MQIFCGERRVHLMLLLPSLFNRGNVTICSQGFNVTALSNQPNIATVFLCPICFVLKFHPIETAFRWQFFGEKLTLMGCKHCVANTAFSSHLSGMF